MGTMAKKINMLLIEMDITKQEHAQRLGTTPSNISGKLKRDNFSEAELQEIANACGATFEGNFITSTGKQI